MRTRETMYTKDIVTKLQYVTIWALSTPWFHPSSINAIYSKQCIYLQADRLGTNLCISDITFCKSTLHIWCCSFYLAVSFSNLSCSVCTITAKIQSLTLFSPGDLAVQLWAFQRNLCMSSIFQPPASLLTTNASAVSSQIQQWGEKRREGFPSTMSVSREKGKAWFDFLLFTRRSHFGRSVCGLWPRSFLFVAAALHCWPPTTDQLQTKTFSAQKEKQGQLFVTDLVLISFHSWPNGILNRSLISFS